MPIFFGSENGVPTIKDFSARSNSSIVETNTTSIEHKLQTLLYAALLCASGNPRNRATAFLMNAKTNEIFKVSITSVNANSLLREVAETKAY